MSKNIVINSMLTDRVYRSYMNFHVYKRDKSYIKLILLSALMLVFGIVNLYANSPIIAFIFISLALYLFASRFMRFYISVNRICTQYNMSNKPRFFYSLSFSNNGIFVTNDCEKTSYPFDKIHHIYMLNDVMYIYINPNNAFIAPFDGLYEQTKKDLINLINKHIDGEKISFIMTGGKHENYEI